MEQQAIQKNNKHHQKISGYEGLVRQNQSGDQSLSLQVDGVHCAGCIKKIESTLYKINGIKSARLNFSTNRLSIEWQGAPLQANDFVQKIGDLGYTVKPFDAYLDKDNNAKDERFLLLCLGLAGFAMGNIMLLSIGLWTTTVENMGGTTRDFMHWISALIAVPAIIFCGQPFFRSAIKSFSSKHLNMDVPISVGLILTTGMSIYETVNHGEHVYFDSAVMLMFFLLVGRYLDFRARRMAKNAALDLMNNFSGFATVINGKTVKTMPVKDVEQGMFVSVAVGEKFPIDGVIKKGQTTVDMALITGETNPVNVSSKDVIYAGTTNLSMPVVVQVTKTADDTVLADVIKLMEKAEQGQAHYVRLADKISRFYTPVVHTLAILAFVVWWGIMGASWQDAMMISVTVLIITCPCALGLAVPVVQVIASGRLMKKGILVKSGDALERLAKINTIIFDKTGTLTHGRPILKSKHSKSVLKKVRALAAYSVHPLSKALLNSDQEETIDLDSVKEYPGQGIEGYSKEKRLCLGSGSWCGIEENHTEEGLVFYFREGDKEPILFKFSDKLRDDAQETLSKIQNIGLKTILLSGDRESEVKRVADKLSIQDFYARVTPVEKFKKLKSLKEECRIVLMIGDGLNDAPVLMGADVSMAPGSAIDIAQNSADIVFSGDKLNSVLETYNVALETQKLVKQNFSFALCYNVVAVPLAFFGMITPLVAAIAMSCSSLFVILNSFRLKLKK